MSWRASLEPLARPGFRTYLLGRTINLLGNSMAPVAVAFAVLHLGGSPGDLGLVLAARSVPLVLFTLYGGALADRIGRDRVLVAACLVAAVVQGVAAYLLVGDLATVLVLGVVEAVHGTVSAFTMPAMQGVVPLVVDRHQIQQANALAAIGRNGAVMVGPAVGGIIVATAGAGWALAADAACFAVAGVLFARLRLPHGGGTAPSMLTQLKEGWTEFTARTWVWAIVVGFGVLNAIWAGAWITLGPVVAEQTIGADGWGLVLSGQAVGLMVGTVLMLRLRVRYPMRAGMLGSLVLAVPMLALGVVPDLALLVVAACIAGIGLDLFSVNWDTALQEHVPQDRLSRVSAYDIVGSFVAIPVGQVVAGPLAELLGVRSVVVGAAVLYVLVALVVLAVPSVWRLRSGSVLAGAGPAP